MVYYLSTFTALPVTSDHSQPHHSTSQSVTHEHAVRFKQEISSGKVLKCLFDNHSKDDIQLWFISCTHYGMEFHMITNIFLCSSDHNGIDCYLEV